MAVLIPASAKDSVANLAPNHLILCQEMEITSKLRMLCKNSLTVRNTTFWTNSIHLTRVKVHLCTWDSLTRQFKRWLWTCSSNLETLWASSKQKVWQTASSMVWILAVWMQRQTDLAFTQTSTRACICSSIESSDLFGTWRSPLLPLPKALTCKCLISKRCYLCKIDCLTWKIWSWKMSELSSVRLAKTIVSCLMIHLVCFWISSILKLQKELRWQSESLWRSSRHSFNGASMSSSFWFTLKMKSRVKSASSQNWWSRWAATIKSYCPSPSIVTLSWTRQMTWLQSCSKKLSSCMAQRTPNYPSRC